MSEVFKKIPQCIGIIPDGNRRFAKKNNISVYEGHLIGGKNIIKITNTLYEEGVSWVVFYCLSEENLQREESEIFGITSILIDIFNNKLGETLREGIRVRVSGDLSFFSEELRESVRDIENRTINNTKTNLVVLLGYGGRQEITKAVNEIVKQNLSFDERVIQENLYVPEMPNLDLIIRTGGDMRLSNFMLWRAAYSELMFIDKMWPEFTPEDLKQCLNDFSDRERRFGK